MDAIGNHSKFIVFKITPPSPILLEMARSRKRKGPFPITSKFNLENFPFQRSIRTRAPTKRVTGEEAFLR